MVRKAARDRLFDPDPPGSPRIGRVRRGWDVTVRAARATGRLEPIDEAVIALGRVVADDADAAGRSDDVSPFVRNALYRTMLDVVTTFRDQTRPDADAHSLDDLLAGLVDAEDRPPD
jgi:hypothetical protein